MTFNLLRNVRFRSAGSGTLWSWCFTSDHEDIMIDDKDLATGHGDRDLATEGADDRLKDPAGDRKAKQRLDPEPGVDED